MLRSKMFSRKISEQRWGAFDLILEHKAAKAGVHYAKVNPNNTSTDCSGCGWRQPMPLGTREYQCPNCGLRLYRDLNAANNICARAKRQRQLYGVGDHMHVGECDQRFFHAVSLNPGS